MNDYDTPEIRCSLWNLSRVTEWEVNSFRDISCLRIQEFMIYEPHREEWIWQSLFPLTVTLTALPNKLEREKW